MKVNETVRAYDLAEALREESGKFRVTTTVGNSTTKGLVSRTKVVVKTFLILATASLGISGLAYAEADSALQCTTVTSGGDCTIAASLSMPLVPAGNSGTLIPVNIAGRSGSSGFTTENNVQVSFANNANVRNNTQGQPVAGPGPDYLIGDFGSETVMDPQMALDMGARYFFSNINGSVTISFPSLQNSLAFLWGSIDPSNIVTLNNGDEVRGTTAQMASNVLTLETGNGFLGPNGSAWVVIDDSVPFNTVTFSDPSSQNTRFEFMAVAANVAPFNPVQPSVPEPSSVWAVIIGVGMIGFGIKVAPVRRRRERDVLQS